MITSVDGGLLSLCVVLTVFCLDGERNNNKSV